MIWKPDITLSNESLRYHLFHLWSLFIYFIFYYTFYLDYTENLLTRSRNRGWWRLVVILGGENWRTRRKTPILDRRPLPCHLPTPGLEPGPQRWQVSGKPLRYPGSFHSIGNHVSDSILKVDASFNPNMPQSTQMFVTSISPGFALVKDKRWIWGEEWSLPSIFWP